MELLTTSNTKVIKGMGRGYMTFILHLAPADSSGKEVCPKRSPGCTAGCLNYAGRGQMHKVQAGRLRKTQWYHQDRAGFMAQLIWDIKAGIRRAERTHAETLVVAEYAGDRRDAMQMMLKEIRAGLFAPCRKGLRRDLGIGHIDVNAIERTQAGHIGNGLDVEYKHGNHNNASFPTPRAIIARFRRISPSCWIWRTRSRVTPISSASSSSVAGLP